MVLHITDNPPCGGLPVELVILLCLLNHDT